MDPWYLHFSASYGHLEICEILISNGASTNSADLWNFSPIHEAASKGMHMQYYMYSNLHKMYVYVCIFNKTDLLKFNLL